MLKNKQIKAYLKDRGFKVSELKIKGFLNDICKPQSDKKMGYILKDQFIEKD